MNVWGRKIKGREVGEGKKSKSKGIWKGKARKGKKNMKNERNSRENGSKLSMWSLNLRKSGEGKSNAKARGGGKESKAIEQYTPLDLRVPQQ